MADVKGLYQLEKPRSEEQKTEKKPEEQYLYDFAVSGIAPGGFPHNAWKKISKEILMNAGDDLFLLGDPKGEESLRDAIASYLHHARGVLCRSEQIVVGAGNDYLLMLLAVLLGSNHTIAMENPTYTSAYHCLKNLGFQVASIPMDESGIQMDELEQSGADLAYVMPSHQFPMGTVMPVKRRMQLLSWASEKPGRYLMEDDYDSEFRYKGRPIPSLQSSDTTGKVIYLGTFSRAIAPSIRISYMVLPESLLPLYEERGRFFSATVSRTDQRIIEVFMREGYFERHLNRMRALYKGKHDLILRQLKELDNFCTVSGENAGVHLLLHLKKGMSEKEAVLRAKEAGVKVYGLSQYCTGTAEEKEQLASGKDRGILLLGYAAMKEEDIVTAIQLLKKAWHAGLDRKSEKKKTPIGKGSGS